MVFGWLQGCLWDGYRVVIVWLHGCFQGGYGVVMGSITGVYGVLTE